MNCFRIILLMIQKFLWTILWIYNCLKARKLRSTGSQTCQKLLFSWKECKVCDANSTNKVRKVSMDTLVNLCDLVLEKNAPPPANWYLYRQLHFPHRILPRNKRNYGIIYHETLSDKIIAFNKSLSIYL